MFLIGTKEFSLHFSAQKTHS